MSTQQISFSVDLDTLTSIHDELNGVHATLTSSSSTTNQYSGDEIGDSGLNDDIDNFFGDWSDYWNQMEQNIGNVLGLLAQAIAAYQGTDQEIGSAVGGATEGLNPPPPAPRVGPR